MKTILLFLLIFVTSICYSQSDSISIRLDKLEESLTKIDSIYKFYEQTHGATYHLLDSLNMILTVHDIERLHLFSKWRLAMNRYVPVVEIPTLHIYYTKGNDVWESMVNEDHNWMVEQDTINIKTVRYYKLYLPEEK